MTATPVSTSSKPKNKPLPLKQRTSSIDPRRDVTAQTWTSVLSLVKWREFVITVDHFSIWRRHLAWAIENGKDLRDYMTQRYASSMVFMSLLLSTELSVLFNSAGVTTAIRQALLHEQHGSPSFWAGIAILISAILTLLSLISTFTAWTMVSAVSEANAHCILRSSIGQYAAELPGRFIVGSIYSFLIWFSLFVFLLLPVGLWSCLLLLLVICLFVHTITAFSAFGRMIMHTGAMGSTPIFDKAYEASLQPHSLHHNLLVKAKANLGNKTSIIRQYRMKSKPIARLYSEDEMSGHLSCHSEMEFSTETSTLLSPKTRRRTESLVKFADGFDTNGDRLLHSPDISEAFPTPRSKEIAFSRDAAHRSRNLSALSYDSFVEPPTTQRRPPRRPEKLVAKEDASPLVVKNQSADVVDRWINAQTEPVHPTVENASELFDSLLTKDKHGHMRRISTDNPYLLFEDPTPFVLSTQSEPPSCRTETMPSPDRRPIETNPKMGFASPLSKRVYGPHAMASDDEVLFNHDYGSDSDENLADREETGRPEEPKTLCATEGSEPILFLYGSTGRPSDNSPV
jgi:hypothetical protein